MKIGFIRESRDEGREKAMSLTSAIRRRMYVVWDYGLKAERVGSRV